MRGTVLDEEHPAHLEFKNLLVTWGNAATVRQSLGHRRVFWTKYPMSLRITDSELWGGGKEYLLPALEPIVVESGRVGGTGQASFVIRQSVSVKYDARNHLQVGLPDVEKARLSVSCAELVQCLFAKDEEGESVFDALSDEAKRCYRPESPDGRGIRAAKAPPKNAPVDLGPDELALIDQLIPKSLPAGYGDF